jgi:hypothetical protein
MTKRVGTAARRKASVMLPLSCYAGLQQEIAIVFASAGRIVTAALKDAEGSV